LTIEDTHNGTAGPNASFIKLDGSYPGALVYARGLACQPGAKLRSYMDSSPVWMGDVDLRGLPATTPAFPPEHSHPHDSKLRIMEG
jgi:hypothetical protein